MNERIRELAEQSGIKVAIVHRVCGTDLTEWQLEHLAEIEKFAELIVRECIDKAFHNGHPDLEFLLKHFGVEE